MRIRKSRRTELLIEPVESPDFNKAAFIELRIEIPPNLSRACENLNFSKTT